MIDELDEIRNELLMALNQIDLMRESQAHKLGMSGVLQNTLNVYKNALSLFDQL